MMILNDGYCEIGNLFFSIGFGVDPLNATSVATLVSLLPVDAMVVLCVEIVEDFMIADESPMA